jgi:hypothetical protein
MIKKIIVTFFTLYITSSPIIANCVTGYACSIKSLNEKDTISSEQNHIKKDQNKNKRIKQKKEQQTTRNKEFSENKKEGM